MVVADTGYKLDVSHDKLVACSEEDLKMPFLVSEQQSTTFDGRQESEIK